MSSGAAYLDPPNYQIITVDENVDTKEHARNEEDGMLAAADWQI